MNTVILFLHIAIASVLTVSTAMVALAAFKQQATQTYEAMLVTFIGTLLSGVALILTVGSIGRVCATMAAVSLVVGVVNHFYKIRLQSQTV